MRPKSNSSLMDVALRALVRRSYTIHEMQEKLKKYSEDSQEITKTIHRLMELKYLDDEAYLDRYLDTVVLFRPNSLKSITLKLKQKGLSPSMVKKTWEEKMISNQDLIMAMYEKRKAKYSLKDEKSKQKFYRYFASKGFSYDEIFSLAKKLESM